MKTKLKNRKVDKRCRPSLLGGDRKENHTRGSISPWRSACVLSFMMQTQDRKR